MAQTEFRDFLLFLFHRTEFPLFSLPLRIHNVIPGVPSIFVPHNGILSYFLFVRQVGAACLFLAPLSSRFRLPNKKIL
jgi:hypothetical protein